MESDSIDEYPTRFVVFANYRKDVPPARYVVIAPTKAEAKRRFKSIIPWLDIYDVRPDKRIPPEPFRCTLTIDWEQPEKQKKE